ncbi:DUF6602 domain-containing protein [Klebsiella grimontii]|uniref:DUF6602 domain-containing protein n=1 Tax=Klebsiella grimontii TaxID=2058152 RepID=UPI0012B72AC2|nr:DUF6602 domain-containing protein [Klebsiella grimontii]
MANYILQEKLNGVLNMLNANYQLGKSSSSAVKGVARSDFINNYLRNVIPQGLRISTSGEIIDNQNNITGELDIIIENGYFPNIPVPSSDTARLYFAEGVAAVIEVKSNLKGQWDEAISTGRKLHAITRSFINTTISSHNGPTVHIDNHVKFTRHLGVYKMPPQYNLINKVPFFVVGYTGWEKLDTLESKLKESDGIVTGILQLDKGFFIGNESLRNVKATGALSLLAFINAIYESYSHIKRTNIVLLSYAR